MGELIDIDQPWSGDDELHIDPAEDAREIGDQLELARRARGKIRVAAFGGERHEPSLDVVQHRDPEPGAGGDDRGVAARHRDALLQHRELARLEDRHRVGERFEVVDHFDTLQIQPGGNGVGVDEPRHVRQPRDSDR